MSDRHDGPFVDGTTSSTRQLTMSTLCRRSSASRRVSFSQTVPGLTPSSGEASPVSFSTRRKSDPTATCVTRSHLVVEGLPFSRPSCLRSGMSNFASLRVDDDSGSESGYTSFSTARSGSSGSASPVGLFTPEEMCLEMTDVGPLSCFSLHTPSEGSAPRGGVSGDCVVLHVGLPTVICECGTASGSCVALPPAQEKRTRHNQLSGISKKGCPLEPDTDDSEDV